MNDPIFLEMPVPIRTPRLLIRHTKPGDGPEINRAIRDSFNDLTKWMPWAEKMPTPEDSEMFARQSYAKWHLREDFTLPIFDCSGKTQFGGTGLHRMNWSIPCFEIGYWVRSTETGKGYITEAVNAVTRYAFQILHAKRIEIRCDADNIKSAKIPERLGYQLEGRLQKSDLKCHNQGVRDTLVFSRTNLDDLPKLEVSWGSIVPTQTLPSIETHRTLLRLASLEDVQKIVDYYTQNESHLRAWDPSWPAEFLTVRYWEEKVRAHLKEFYEDRSVRFFVFGGTDKKELIGTAEFTNIIRGPLQGCFLGYSLAKSSEGQGLMTEALQAAIQYLFKEKNIHRIQAGYLPENSRSGKVLEHLGFLKEAHVKNYLRFNNQWRDNILTSLTNKNWT
jgi:ribosomal-protein-alanine N-acetyltransferase